MLPFTPITYELLEPDWIKEELPFLKSCLNRPGLEEGWKGFVIMAEGIIEPLKAYKSAQQLKYFDNGNSKTNTLHWISSLFPSKDLQSSQ